MIGQRLLDVLTHVRDGDNDSRLQSPELRMQTDRGESRHAGNRQRLE